MNPNYHYAQYIHDKLSYYNQKQHKAKNFKIEYNKSERYCFIKYKGKLVCRISDDQIIKYGIIDSDWDDFYNNKDRAITSQIVTYSIDLIYKKFNVKIKENTW